MIILALASFNHSNFCIIKIIILKSLSQLILMVLFVRYRNQGIHTFTFWILLILYKWYNDRQEGFVWLNAPNLGTKAWNVYQPMILDAPSEKMKISQSIIMKTKQSKPPVESFACRKMKPWEWNWKRTQKWILGAVIQFREILSYSVA